MATAAKLSPADAVATRRSNFRDLGASLKVITDELKKPQPDKPTIERAAMEIHDFGDMQKLLFPKGSGQEAGVPTRARDEIWTDAKGFAAQQAAFAAEGGKLHEIAKGGDLTAIAAQHKLVAGQCAACHAKYRE